MSLFPMWNMALCVTSMINSSVLLIHLLQHLCQGCTLWNDYQEPDLISLYSGAIKCFYVDIKVYLEWYSWPTVLFSLDFSKSLLKGYAFQCGAAYFVCFSGDHQDKSCLHQLSVIKHKKVWTWVDVDGLNHPTVAGGGACPLSLTAIARSEQWQRRRDWAPHVGGFDGGTEVVERQAVKNWAELVQSRACWVGSGAQAAGEEPRTLWVV